MTHGQAVSQWFQFRAAEEVSGHLAALAADGRNNDLFAEYADWVRENATYCEEAIDRLGLDVFIAEFVRKPYTPPTVAELDFEHLIDLECRANPYM
jgi:hypothetical protein